MLSIVRGPLMMFSATIVFVLMASAIESCVPFCLNSLPERIRVPL